MYWASQVERARLEELIRQQFESWAYPDNRSLVYVIGAFFFSRREQIITELKGYLPKEQANVVKRLMDCPDARTYLTSGRIPGVSSWWVEEQHYDLSQVMDERETTGQDLFDRLMQYHTDGNVPNVLRQLAHQLDMLVHGDLSS